MPITPLHFGPSALVSLPLNKYIDVPVFILANVIVDVEPLLVILFGLNYPLHGYAHTYLFGGVIGVFFGIAAFYLFRPLNTGMKILGLPYKRSFKRTIISAILGIWFHVFLDSFLYPDIKPFYPIQIKPLYNLLDASFIYKLSLVSIIPAIIIYIFKFVQHRKVNP